jgi:hypothetical protein
MIEFCVKVFSFELPYGLFGIFMQLYHNQWLQAYVFYYLQFNSNFLIWHSYKGEWKFEVWSCFVHSILPRNLDVFSPKIQDHIYNTYSSWVKSSKT